MHDKHICTTTHGHTLVHTAKERKREVQICKCRVKAEEGAHCGFRSMMIELYLTNERGWGAQRRRPRQRQREELITDQSYISEVGNLPASVGLPHTYLRLCIPVFMCVCAWGGGGIQTAGHTVSLRRLGDSSYVDKMCLRVCEVKFG